jgi:hypothetical protein
MALSHAGMARIAFLAQYVGTYRAMLQVRFLPVAVYAGSIAAEYSKVVQHGSLFQKLHVDRQFLMLFHNLQTAVGNLAAMLQ